MYLLIIFLIVTPTIIAIVRPMTIIEWVDSVFLFSKNIIKRVYSRNKEPDLVLPDSVERIYCDNNKITSLVLPDSAKYVRCDNYKIASLVLPDSAKYVRCDNYKIASLVLPD